MVVIIFQRQPSSLPVFLHFCQKAGAAKLQTAGPGVTPQSSWVSLLMAASFLRLAVQLARDASDALESNEIVMRVVEEQPDEVMVRGELAWRDGGKHSNAKGGREGGLPIVGLPCWLALLLAYCSNLPLK